MSPPAWAYQLDAFDPPPDDELVCSICHCVFCDPVQSPCHHVFCRACIHKWLEMNRNCPICRKRTIRYAIQEVVPLIRNMIMKLALRCHNAERGCEARFTLEACEGHVKECVFEMIQCKNRPCKQMVLRKDMGDHELHDCSHRYFQCKKCGLKVSLVLPQKHDCIKALKLCLKEKVDVIKKKKQKIKDLQNEIKTLKENEQRHSSTSSMDSIGEAALEMNLNDMSGLSSGSSVSSTSLASNSEIDDEVVSSFTFDILEGLERRFRNSTEEYQVEDDSIEYPRDSSPYATGEASAANALDFSTGAEEDESPIRRPAKRRLPPRISDSSDGNEDYLERNPSPKRVWRFNRLGGGETSALTNNQTSEESSGMAGPSTSATIDTITAPDVRPTAFRLRPRRGRRGQTPPSITDEYYREPAADAYVGGTFERTIAMLSQYNLESDPEWVPGGGSDPEWRPRNSDPVGESESFPIPLSRDPYITSSDESSLSDSESDSELGDFANAPKLFADMYSSSDDSDFLPI